MSGALATVPKMFIVCHWVLATLWKIPLWVLKKKTTHTCSLSLRRAAHGSKRMFLQLIHGLFITWTEFRLSTTFIPIIIIMYIHNWHHSNVSSILLCTRTQITIYMAHSPCFFFSPCWFSFVSLCSPFTLFYLLGTLLAVTGSVHLGLRLLVNWPPLSQPSPQTPPSNSQNPNYPAPH